MSGIFGLPSRIGCGLRVTRTDDIPSLQFRNRLSEGVRMNIYVGNLSYDATEDDVRQAFGGYGDVSSVSIITDRETGKSRGFGFVEMPNDDEARAAIEGLNGEQIAGRAVTVNEARPRSGGGGGRRDRRY